MRTILSCQPQAVHISRVAIRNVSRVSFAGCKPPGHLLVYKTIYQSSEPPRRILPSHHHHLLSRVVSVSASVGLKPQLHYGYVYDSPPVIFAHNVYLHHHSSLLNTLAFTQSSSPTLGVMVIQRCSPLTTVHHHLSVHCQTTCPPHHAHTAPHNAPQHHHLKHYPLPTFTNTASS